MNAAAPSAPGDLAIKVDDRPATFLLRPVGWGRNDVYQLAPRTLDLLLIAGSVFTADSLVRRGGDTRSGLGIDWRRDLRFIIPVRDADFWVWPGMR